LDEVKGITKKRLGIIQIVIFWILEDNAKLLEEYITFSTQIDVTHKTAMCHNPENHNLKAHH
jgi:hypothetical protein